MTEFQPTNEEPVLKIPEGWEERSPEGWEWQTLWDAVENGDNVYADNASKKRLMRISTPGLFLMMACFQDLICRLTVLARK